MNVILDFIWTLPVQLQGTCNKWALQKNLVHGRIRTTNTARPPDYKSTVITTQLQLPWYEMDLNVHETYNFLRSINKRVNLCTYIGSTWCTCVLPLQPYCDITSVLFCRLINVDILLLFLTIFICNKRNIRQPIHCWCDIHAPARCCLTVI